MWWHVLDMMGTGSSQLFLGYSLWNLFNTIETPVKFDLLYTTFFPSRHQRSGAAYERYIIGGHKVKVEACSRGSISWMRLNYLRMALISRGKLHVKRTLTNIK
jgi:hypothetical protein